MNETDHDGDEDATLRREIAAIDAKLAFVTSGGGDERRLNTFRAELLERRHELEQLLAELS